MRFAGKYCRGEARSPAKHRQTRFAGGVTWYRERDPELATRFLDEVYKTLDLIARFPGAGGRVFGVRDATIRQLPVNGFPYQVVFQRLEHRTAILAIAHERRRPGNWME